MTFNAILKEGVFYTDLDFEDFKRDQFAPYHNIYLVENGAKRTISDILTPLLDTEIVFSMHYVIDPKAIGTWGLGSCYMEHLDWCPCHHHNEDKNRVLNVSVEGKLGKQDKDHLYIEKANGEKYFLPFYLLVGHKGRIATASVMTVGEMKNIVLDEKNLADQLSYLEELMGNLKEKVK